MSPSAAAWDLTALVNAADAKAGLAERHLWLVRLMEWLRHVPTRREAAAGTEGAAARPERSTPMPVLRLRHLLRVLDQSPEHKAQVQAMFHAFWREIDAVALLADFGFSNRMALRSELWQRLRAEVLPGSPATRDLAALFPLLFRGSDADWIERLDEELLDRIAELVVPRGAMPQEMATPLPAASAAPAEARPGIQPTVWRQTLLDAISILVSAVQAAGFSPPLRQRMSPALLASEPFRQLPLATEQVRSAVLAGEREVSLQATVYLRALLDTCRRATDSSCVENTRKPPVSSATSDRDVSPWPYTRCPAATPRNLAIASSASQSPTEGAGMPSRLPQAITVAPGTTVPALIALHAGATSGGRRCTGAHGPITTTTRTRPP